MRVRTEERRQSFRLNAIWPREFRTAEAPPYTDDIHALAMLWDAPMNTRVEDLIFDVVQGLTTELDFKMSNTELKMVLFFPCVMFRTSSMMKHLGLRFTMYATQSRRTAPLFSPSTPPASPRPPCVPAADQGPHGGPTAYRSTLGVVRSARALIEQFSYIRRQPG